MENTSKIQTKLDEFRNHHHNAPLTILDSQLTLSSFRGRLMSSELQSDVRYRGAIWWMLTGWRRGVVDWNDGVR